MQLTPHKRRSRAVWGFDAAGLWQRLGETQLITMHKEIPPPNVGGMAVRGARNKSGKQGRRETVSGNGTSLLAALVSPSLRSKARTIPRTQ